MAQNGAVVLAGRHNVMEDCVVEAMNASGATFRGEDMVVRRCVFRDNDDAGIFYEISFALRAHDNVIVGNGFAPTAGAWGAQAAISLSSSPGCVIERNLMVGNHEGFNFREQTRSTPTIENRTDLPVWNHDQLVRHNVLAINRDAQVWGWFKWGPTWARHKSYTGLPEFESDLQIDFGGQVSDPGFADLLQRDFRLAAGAPADLRANYPRGPVPEVALGEQ